MGYREVLIEQDRHVDGYGRLFAGRTYSLDDATADALEGRAGESVPERATEEHPELERDAERSAEPETAAVRPRENAARRTGRLEPRHVGGGWYEVGDERVQGKDAAAARARELAGE